VGGLLRRARWLLLLALLPMLTACGDSFGWYVVDPTNASGWLNLKFMLSGLWYTIALSLTAMSISLVIGLIVALPALTWCARCRSWF